MIKDLWDDLPHLIQIWNQRLTGRKVLEIKDFEEITGGWETKIYSANVRFEKNGSIFNESYVFRVYQGVNPQEQAVRESGVMRAVRERGVPTPRVELCVTNDSAFKEPFVVMDQVEGVTAFEKLQGASEREKADLTQQMIEPLVQLHRIPWREVFGDIKSNIQLDEAPLALVDHRLEELKRIMGQFKLPDFDPYLKWLGERRELGASHGLCILHNDYHPQNVLVGGGDPAELSIIDWSFADVGDFRLDLAWSVLLFGVMLGTRYREFVVECYEEASGEPVEQLEFFEVMKFTERMLTIATWMDESVVIPVKKITRQAIRTDYKVHVLNVYDRLKAITGMNLPVIENL